MNTSKLEWMNEQTAQKQLLIFRIEFQFIHVKEPQKWKDHLANTMVTAAGRNQ